MYSTVGSLASPRSGLRRGASLLILMCGYANEPETKDPHRPAIQTVSSQNRSVEFQNSFFPSILDPRGSIVRSPFSRRFFRFRDIYTVSPGFVSIPTARRFKRFPAKTARPIFKTLFFPESSIFASPYYGLLFLIVFSFS